MSSNENEELFPRPKRYKLMLDPNYEPSMVSDKTRKTWSEASELKLAEVAQKCKFYCLYVFNADTKYRISIL